MGGLRAQVFAPMLEYSLPGGVALPVGDLVPQTPGADFYALLPRLDAVLWP